MGIFDCFLVLMMCLYTLEIKICQQSELCKHFLFLNIAGQTVHAHITCVEKG